MLRERDYVCDRLTHVELMSIVGEEYTAKLARMEYQLLWVSTPIDWYVRAPGKRATPHWQRIQHWITKAAKLNLHAVLF